MAKWFLVLPPEGAARAVAEQSAGAFRELLPDNDLGVFDTRRYLSAFDKLLRSPTDEVVVDLVNHALAVQCLDMGATRALVMALSPVTLFTLRLLQKYNVKTIHWFFEDFRRATYWKDVLPGYDVFLGVQRGDLQSAVETADARFEFLPTASSLQTRDPAPASAPVDVAFVGVPSPYRISVLQLLQSQGISLTVAGAGWKSYVGPLASCVSSDSWVDSGELSDLLSRARIGLNLSFADPREDRPHAQISPRVFDILAAQRSLVTEELPLVHEVLDGYHYDVFDSPEQAVVRIRDVLSRNDKDAAQLQRNRVRVMSRDTYSCRSRQIIEIVE